MEIGIDIGGTHIAVGLVDNGRIISKKEKDFTNSDRINIEKSIEDIIVQYIDAIIKENNIKEQITRIGISAPGTCTNEKMVRLNKLGIVNFNIAGALKKYYSNAKITLSNDAKCAALCEKKYGTLKEFDDAIFLCFGTGVGGAVFLERKIIKTKKISGI